MYRKNIIVVVLGVDGDGRRRITVDTVRSGALTWANLVHVSLDSGIIDRDVPTHLFRCEAGEALEITFINRLD